MSTYYEKKKLRAKGMTYKEIADELGVTEGVVGVALAQRSTYAFKELDEERCIYAGLRNWMNENKVSVVELTRRLGRIPYPNAYQKYRNWLIGFREPRKSDIDEILELTGLTYEEAFRID